MTARTAGRAAALTALLTPALLTLSLLTPALGGAAALAGERVAPDVDEKTQAAELLAGFKDKDPTKRVRALEKAKSNQHASLTAPLVRLLSDKELGVRLGAIEALAARTERAARKKAASSLSSRLKRLSKSSADEDELYAVIQSLGGLGQPVAIKPLIDPIHLDMDMDEVKARLQAVAEIPHGDSVEALIDFLAQGRRGGRAKHRRAAHDALRYLTGGNPGEYRASGKDADRWRAWWKDNKKAVDLVAVAEARRQAAAEKQARAERKKKQQEERKKKREERKKKQQEERKKKKPQSEPRID